MISFVFIQMCKGFVSWTLELEEPPLHHINIPFHNNGDDMPEHQAHYTIEQMHHDLNIMEMNMELELDMEGFWDMTNEFDYLMNEYIDWEWEFGNWREGWSNFKTQFKDILDNFFEEGETWEI